MLNGAANVSDTVVVASVNNSTSDTSITSTTNTERSSDADVTKTCSDNIIFPWIQLNENDTKIIQVLVQNLNCFMEIGMYIITIFLIKFNRHF